MMRTLITLCCVLLVGLTLAPGDAEAAKRFGGGGSFGKFFATPKKTQPTLQPQRTTTQRTAAATPVRRPGLGGLFGGLLAGGLLAALFMGGAFEGVQPMDLLILGGLAFLAFKLFARARPPQPQYAGYGQPQEAPVPQPFTPTPLMSNGLAAEELALPNWFNRDAFLEGARQHFAQLQQAWNRNDLEEIRSYCAPALFEALVAERRRLGADPLDNDLVSVMAELAGFNEVDGEAQLSINFYGWMREGAEAQTTEFNEIWHLTRDLGVANADWFIVGIEQPG